MFSQITIPTQDLQVRGPVLSNLTKVSDPSPGLVFLSLGRTIFIDMVKGEKLIPGLTTTNTNVTIVLNNLFLQLTVIFMLVRRLFTTTLRAVQLTGHSRVATDGAQAQDLAFFPPSALIGSMFFRGLVGPCQSLISFSHVAIMTGIATICQGRLVWVGR